MTIVHNWEELREALKKDFNAKELIILDETIKGEPRPSKGDASHSTKKILKNEKGGDKNER